MKEAYLRKITLNSPWFEYVRDGVKVYEGRRNKKENPFTVGEVLWVYHHTNTNMIPYYVRITECLKFSTFEDALNSLSLSSVLPNITSVKDGIEIYKKYVSLETQKKDGIVMLRLERIY